jgi:hypothetical protein
MLGDSMTPLRQAAQHSGRGAARPKVGRAPGNSTANRTGVPSDRAPTPPPPRACTGSFQSGVHVDWGAQDTGVHHLAATPALRECGVRSQRAPVCQRLLPLPEHTTEGRQLQNRDPRGARQIPLLGRGARSGVYVWLPNRDQMSYSACRLGPRASHWVCAKHEVSQEEQPPAACRTTAGGRRRRPPPTTPPRVPSPWPC